MKKFFFIIFTTLIVYSTVAQVPDNQPIKRDSTPSVSVEKTLKNDSFPVPKKALLWSLVPAGGQIYNRRQSWWKAPVVLAGFGVSIYSVSFNTVEYRRFKEAYRLRANGLPFEDDKISGTASVEKIKQVRDAYFKQLQQAYIGVGITYLVSGVWAFADAHLAHFDVNDDLSMRFKPSFEPTPMGNSLGIGINLQF